MFQKGSVRLLLPAATLEGLILPDDHIVNVFRHVQGRAECFNCRVSAGLRDQSHLVLAFEYLFQHLTAICHLLK